MGEKVGFPGEVEQQGLGKEHESEHKSQAHGEREATRHGLVGKAAMWGLGDEFVWHRAAGDWTPMCKCPSGQGIGTPLSEHLTYGLISDGLDSFLITEIMYLGEREKKNRKALSQTGLSETEPGAPSPCPQMIG